MIFASSNFFKKINNKILIKYFKFTYFLNSQLKINRSENIIEFY